MKNIFKSFKEKRDNKYVSNYCNSITSDSETMRQISQLRIDAVTGKLQGIPIGKP